MIYVTPASRLESIVEQTDARHLISLMTEGALFTRPAEIPEENHLHLTMHDISEPREGMTPPDAHHLASILQFTHRWTRDAPLVVNCYAGISRSTAAAFVLWCAFQPERNESELAQILRSKSPSATPNSLIVRLGDEALGRDGRMTEAIAEIGRGQEAFEGSPFCLDI